MAAEHIRKWQVGDVEIARLVEVNDHTDPFTMINPDLTAADALKHDWLKPHFITPDGLMRISFQCFVLRSGKDRIMIDTCIGNGRQREYDVFTNLRTSFLEDLETAGFPREAITKVLCTHLHFDHVGWNTMEVNGKWVPTFPNARYIFGRAEYEHWKELERTGEYHDLTHMGDSINPVVDAGMVELVEPNAQITEEVSIFPTPGHTPGHVSVAITSKGAEAVITGDMMHHPLQLAEWAREVSFDMDKEAGIKSRRAFIDRVADKDILVIGTHFTDPTSGYVLSDTTNWKLKAV
jgi:glyoxylase-like metal-dependent hydrolase (beta-lactamase superfamily II)